MSAPELSVVVLCYRAGESITRVIEPLYRQLEEAGVAFELVLVANYDSDDDDTPDVVRRTAADWPEARPVIRRKEGGMGWDMRSGLATATGSVIAVMDGDAQNPVEDVRRMYDRMREGGIDLMKGRRIARFDGLHRSIVSWVYNAVFRVVFRTRGIWDINGKPKALTREAYQRMHLTSDDWFIDAEIVLEAKRLGLAIDEMPVVFHRNDERASFVRGSAIVEFLRNMALARLGRAR